MNPGPMLKLTTWNVNGIRARERDVLALIERERPDVLCLQEVKASIEQVPPALCELPGYHCYWHGHKGYSGVALHLSHAAFPARPEFAHPEFDHETRIVSARAGDLLFASIYVPNGGKDFDAKVRFLDALDAYARDARAAGLRVVLCGDLNVAREERDVHPSLRKPDLIGCTPAERAQLERVIAHGLVDLSRKFQPEDDQLFTWWAPWRNLRQKNVGWRIDYVLCSSVLAERAARCSVDREFGGSDHAPLTAEFDFDPPRVAAGGTSEQTPRAGQLRLF
jgi:exodeoxyribonuclease-3